MVKNVKKKSRRFGKRGMSPLIATVLLMAFAVALGGMIINWSSNLPNQTDCSNIKLNINKICYKDQNIYFNARNVGDESISQISFRLDNALAKYNMDLEDSSLDKGESINRKVPAIIDENTKLSIIVKKEFSGEVIECDEPVKVIAPLKECS